MNTLSDSVCLIRVTINHLICFTARGQITAADSMQIWFFCLLNNRRVKVTIIITLVWMHVRVIMKHFDTFITFRHFTVRSCTNVSRLFYICIYFQVIKALRLVHVSWRWILAFRFDVRIIIFIIIIIIFIICADLILMVYASIHVQIFT